MTACLTTTLTLAFGLAIGSPLSALADSSVPQGGRQDGGPGTNTPQPAPGTHTAPGAVERSPQTSAKERPALREQSEKKEGLSRDKEDCAKSGCVDSGGN
jgi:hypothetical protein